MHNHHFFVLALAKIGRKPHSLLKSEERQQDEGRRKRKGMDTNWEGSRKARKGELYEGPEGKRGQILGQKA